MDASMPYKCFLAMADVCEGGLTLQRHQENTACASAGCRISANVL